IFSEHISGDSCMTPARRSSTAMVGEPPVVMLTTASVACLMRGRNCMNTAGSPVGRPSCGLRACRCRIAAPASAAPIACEAIWSGVIGRASDMVGVWMAPVMAQLMMTLSDLAAMALAPGSGFQGSVCGHIRGKAQAPLQRQKLPAETPGDQSPDALGGKQHDRYGHGAEHQQIEAAEIGQCLPQQEEDDSTDDRPLDPANAADHGDEDDEGGPVVDAERGVGRDAQLLQEDERTDHRRAEGGE